MKVTGASLDEVKAAVECVSKEIYDGNLKVSSHSRDRSWGDVPRCTFQLKVVNPEGSGAKLRSATQSGCWHAHFDVFDELLGRNESVVIDTVMAVYNIGNFDAVSTATRDDSQCNCVRDNEWWTEMEGESR